MSGKTLKTMRNMAKRAAILHPIPSLPVLQSALATVRDLGFLERFTVNSMLRMLDSKPLLHIPARDLLFGYEDRLFSMAKFASNIPFEKFGLMVPVSLTPCSRFDSLPQPLADECAHPG